MTLDKAISSLTMPHYQWRCSKQEQICETERDSLITYKKVFVLHLQEHWRERSKGLLQDFASGKLGRAKPRSRANSHTCTSIINEDDDYDLLRGMWYHTSDHSHLFQPWNKIEFLGLACDVCSPLSNCVCFSLQASPRQLAMGRWATLWWSTEDQNWVKLLPETTITWSHLLPFVRMSEPL